MERMRQLEGFYFEHQTDGRAILFEKQRMKLRGALQPRVGPESRDSPPDRGPRPRRSSLFPEYWVPLRDGRSIPEIHAEVVFVSGVCEDLLLQLQANPQDRELRTRLATYLASVEDRLPDLEVDSRLEDAQHLQVLLERDRQTLRALVKRMRMAQEEGAGGVRTSPPRSSSHAGPPRSANARSAARGRGAGLAQRSRSPGAAASHAGPTTAGKLLRSAPAPVLLEFKVYLTRAEYEEFLARKNHQARGAGPVSGSPPAARSGQDLST